MKRNKERHRGRNIKKRFETTRARARAQCTTAFDTRNPVVAATEPCMWIYSSSALAIQTDPHSSSAATDERTWI